MSHAKALKAINEAGILLVYPIKNAREPPSLWSRLYPHSPMKWDWSESADDRVVKLWHLKTELSEERDVVYCKWYQGRATFFSRPVFTALLRLLGAHEQEAVLTSDAAELYRLLLDDSPQTPKMLRAALGLEGRLYEGAFNRAQRPLWQYLLVVGAGEVDEGAFPALAIGATRHLFEDLWAEAGELGEDEAEATLTACVPEDSLFFRYYRRLKKARLASTESLT